MNRQGEAVGVRRTGQPRRSTAYDRVMLGLLGAGALAWASAGEFFDDFAAGGKGALAAHGWTRRHAAGAPGPAGARWNPDAIELRSGLLWLTASTDGTVRGTEQAELCQRR